MRKLFAALIILTPFLCTTEVNAQAYWQTFEEKEPPVTGTIKKPVQQYKIYQSDKVALSRILSAADTHIDRSRIILLPMADGNIKQFYIWQTPVMEPLLAERYPEINTYTAVSKDDPAITAKLEYTLKGFSGIIFNGRNIDFIEPYNDEAKGYYIVYAQKDRIYKNISCLNNAHFPGSYIDQTNEEEDENTAQRLVGNIRHTYRFALSCTGEYAHLIANNPTKPMILSEMAATTNHINGYYEREFAFSLVLVNNNDAIIYTDTATDPYTCNLDCECLINQANTHVMNVIGTNNFDIGYTLCTAGGGLGAVGVLCNASGKAAGVGYSSGADDIAVLIHEMGHQFGSSHTFNANTGGCLNNADSANAFEPGAGISIMSYAGGCDPNSVGEKEPFYHVRSLLVIADQVAGAPGTCGLASTAANPISAPVITDTFYTIPQNTPFELTAPIINHDANTAILYNWEQWDLGNFQSTESQNAQAITGPLFKSRYPTEERVRSYPSAENIFAGTYGDGINGAGQRISKRERDIHFKLTIRRISDGWGALFITDNNTHIRTARTATDFRVTQPAQDVSWEPGTLKTVTWNVSGSDGDTVKCKWVNIYLSEDNGLTFPHLLVANAPNTGSYTLTVPNVNTTQGRIKVKAAGGIFFDLAKGTISINGSNTGIGNHNVREPLLNIYPNPAKDLIYIENNTAIPEFRYQLYNSAGQQIGNGTVVKQTQIRTSRLPRGIYFLRFSDDKGTQHTQTVILE